MLLVLVIVAVFGFILLMFAISMLAQLWPLLLVGAGIWFFVWQRRR